MYNVNVTTAAYVELHDGRSLANLYSTTSLLLASSNAPASANIATWPANVPLYLPQGGPTFAKAASANGTVQVVRNFQ
jgi:hypothetical protein